MGTCQCIVPNVNRRKPVADSSQSNLICRICLQRFNMQEKLPMMICINQHNLCSQCVGLFAEKRNNECPFCKVDFDYRKATKNRLIIEKMETDCTEPSLLRPGRESINSKESVLVKAQIHNHQQVIYFIHMGPKKPLEEVKQIIQEKSSITFIINLSIFPNLRRISLKENNISKINDFGVLEHLTYLNLSNNQITKIQNLNQFLKLKNLALHNNKITKLEYISSLIELQFLDLSNNEIVVIEGISNLLELKSLSLSSNKITKIRNLNGLRSLEKLWLRYNRIKVLEGIFELPRLKEIKIDVDTLDCKLSEGAIRALKDLHGIELAL